MREPATTFEAAVAALREVYSGDSYPAVPGGFSGPGGMRENFVTALRDVAKVGQGVSERASQIAAAVDAVASAVASAQAAAVYVDGALVAFNQVNDLAMQEIETAVSNATGASETASQAAASIQPGVAGGVATLGMDGLLTESQRPPVPISGGGSWNFLAAGAITAGQVVALVGDGVVAAVSESVGTSVSAPYQYETGEISGNIAVYDAAYDRVVVFYADVSNGSYLTASVMRLDQEIIDVEDVVFVASSADYGLSACSMGGGKIFVAKTQGPSTTNCYIFDLVSRSFSAASTPISMVVLDCSWDVAQSKALIVGWPTSWSTEYAVVVPVTGSTIGAPGALTRFNGGAVTRRMSVSYDPATTKHVVLYSDEGGSGHPEMVVATISGTSVSFTVPTTLEAAAASSTGHSVLRYDSASGLHVALWGTNAGQIKVAAISLLGTSISIGAIATVAASYLHNGRNCDVIASAGGKIILIWRDYASGYLKAASASIFGSAVSVDLIVTVRSAVSQYPVGAYVQSQGRVIICYGDGASAPPGYAVALAFSLSTAPTWVGIADATVTNGQGVKVNIIGGVDAHQVGLTTGSYYFANNTGGLTLTNRGAAYKVGRALSPSTIYITGGGGQ